MLLSLIVLGCQKSQNPLAVTSSEQNGSRSLEKKGSVVQSVTGSGHFTTDQADFRTFSFTARRYADGSVNGQWERIRRTTGNAERKSHGKVTCFTIIGTQAWLGGYATSGIYVPGEVGWRVVDNGEGKNAPTDQISLQYVDAPEGFAADYCATTPEAPAPLHDIESGNIQIHE